MINKYPLFFKKKQINEMVILVVGHVIFYLAHLIYAYSTIGRYFILYYDEFVSVLNAEAELNKKSLLCKTENFYRFFVEIH